MAFRFAFLFLLFTSLYGALGAQLYNLQIEQGGEYVKQAQSRTLASGLLIAPRGNIYFVDKNQSTIPAAIGKQFPAVYAVPKQIQDANEAAHALASVLPLSPDALFKKLNKPGDPYESILSKASGEEIQKLKELGLGGVYVDSEEHRFYPLGRIASQVLGFTTPDENGQSVGKYGLELFFDDMLAGKNGTVDGGSIVRSKPGENLTLTIDYHIQSRAESILEQLVKDWGAESGVVIVQEPKTGKVLAMAGKPDFDPNQYGTSEFKNFLNPAVQAIYEPGSIFKVITMAAGIDSGAITPETTYFDTGSLTLNGKTIKNWDLKGHGKITMTEVIEQSINTGAAFAEKQTGHDTFRQYLEKFGFTRATGIKLPGELKGSIAPLVHDPRDINFATASFGQGISVTPVALVNSISTIANGGVLMRPLVLADEKPEMLRKVISEDAAGKVRGMMVSAVDKAEVAKIPGYSVAGKTGTAQIPNFKKGGYTDQVINTYVGFAPASDPKFTILFKLDKPQGAPLAGATVVPAFRNLAEFILNYYSIPPDRVEATASRQ